MAELKGNPMDERPPTAKQPQAIGIEPPTAQFPSTGGLAAYRSEHGHLLDKARWKHPVRGLKAAARRKMPVCVCKGYAGCDHKPGECHRATTDIDHIIDHNGNERLAYDFKNLQGLCHECHSRKTALTFVDGERKTPQPERPALVGDKVRDYGEEDAVRTARRVP